MIYNYECWNCNATFEYNLTVDERYDPTYKVCPECNHLTVKKATTSVPFKIKGFSSKNGFSNNVGDIEKHLGREITNNDLDD